SSTSSSSTSSEPKKVTPLQRVKEFPVPLGKICHFRELFEGVYRLGDRHTLSDLVQKQEKQHIVSELSGCQILIIFDGTCRLG
ncbi:hypothetical protein GBAR_LOCUS22784, partial [Geodia barretti]